MPMTLPEGEPEAGPWRAVPLPELLDLILEAAGRTPGRPRIVAIDGRGASGKSTLTVRLQRHARAAAVVHTDDLAWHEPLFGWGHLLGDVLRTSQKGRALSYRPPQWEQRGRDGALSIPAGLDLVLVEGTGASQREHAELIDATVWVQADHARAEERGIARDIAEGVNGDPEQATAFWHEWMAAELAFFAHEQPWRRACVVVGGTPNGPLDADHVEIAPPFR